MIHQCQGLLLGLEASDHGLCIQAEFNNLKRHTAVDWLDLLRHVHNTATAFPDFLEQFITANEHAHVFIRQAEVPALSFEESF
jgi:hypothetical protein